MSARVARTLCWLACASLLTPVAVEAADPLATKHVLILHREGVSNPFRSRFDAAFVEAVRATGSVPFALHEETIETEPSAGESDEAFRDYLQNKYTAKPIDVVVAVGDLALAFARENRWMFGDPPIVAVVSGADQLKGKNDDVTGLYGGAAFGGTIDLAQMLRPDIDQVFIVYGARDGIWESMPEMQRVEAEHPGLQFVYLRDLPLADLVARVATIPERSIVLFVRQSMRDRLEDLDQFVALSRVTRASPVPVFSTFEHFVGHGIVGGNMWRFEMDAIRMAEMVRRIALDARPSDMPAGRITHATVLDWRELQRWQIADARVPGGSVVLFRQPSFFEMYRPVVLSGLLVSVAQLLLIVGLLVQRGRCRRAEEEARKNEELYRSVVDTQSDLLARFLPDGTLTFVNDAYCRFWNTTRGELLGRTFLTLIPPEARETVWSRLANIPPGGFAHEHQVTLPDGTTGWQFWSNHAILDNAGRIVEIQAVGRDITDQKRAEEQLLRSETRHSAILRAMPDMMFVIRADGTYLDHHVRDSRQLFAPPEAFIGRTVREIMPQPLADNFMRAVDEALGSADPVVVEYELPIDGDQRSYEARLVAGGPQRVIAIVRDMTDTARASARNRDLAGRLIYSQEMERSRIARELHDDLSQKVALLNIEIDQLADLGGTRRERLHRLKRVGAQVSGLAIDVHQLAHRLHPSRLQMLGLESALQALCTEVSEQHGLPITFTHGPVPKPIDPNVTLCLYRITQESLHNVLRHSHARQASVTLHCNDGKATLEVVDDGVGFDPQSAERTGLGLVSMRERVGFVQGSMQIHSTPGNGTRMVIVVPVPDLMASGAAADQSATRTDNASATSSSALRKSPLV